MAVSGQGFQVNRATVLGAGQSAVRIGENITNLANDAGPACDVPPEPAGLEVGATLLAVAPLWEQHLRNVGADVEHTGQTLCQVSAGYDKAENSITQSIRRIQA